LPNLHQIIAPEATLTEDFTGHVTIDETIAGLIPSSEDLIIIFLFLL
jgi:hypothetical protein